jgi:hypothetical protein
MAWPRVPPPRVIAHDRDARGLSNLQTAPADRCLAADRFHIVRTTRNCALRPRCLDGGQLCFDCRDGMFLVFATSRRSCG